MHNHRITHTDIFVSDIRLRACHGVLPQERLTGNDYVVSVTASCHVDDAIDTDDVALTLNYAEVYRTVKEQMDIPSNLVEHVAGRIAHRLLSQHTCIDQVKVKVVKTNPPMGAHCAGAGVEITMRRT